MTERYRVIALLIQLGNLVLKLMQLFIGVDL